MDSDLNGNQKKRAIGFSYAWNGILHVVRTEKNFRIHMIAACLVIAVSLILGLSLTEWIIILLTISLVMITEMVNTAIERIMDFIRPDISPEAKVIKDIAAGAVLIAAICSVIIGILIFLPKLYRFF